MNPAGLLNWVEIDLAAIESNARWAVERLERGQSLMAVVKADGYGHGAAACAKAALKAGTVRLGVRDVAEDAALRQAGIKAPIQLLAPILPEQAEEAVRLGATPTIDCLEQARALAQAAKGGTVQVHLDVDLGLGRWGSPPSAVSSA
jgi:alanine racemase